MKVLNIADSRFNLYPIGAIKEFTFKGLSFFVHRSIDGNCFTIAEYQTGMRITSISSPEKSLDEMYDFYDEFFKDKKAFKERMEKKILENIKNRGVANK